MSRYKLQNDHEFEVARKKAEGHYNSLKELYCPYFKEKIVFNTKGWEHI